MANLTPKQEKFCQRYIETGNASLAYRDSYDCQNMKDETVNVKASELLKNGKIAVRLDELRSVHQERHDVTIDDMVAKYDEAYELAKQNSNPSAMISAISAKSRLLGLDKFNRTEIKLKELEAQIRQLEIEKLLHERSGEATEEITINVVRVGNE